MDLNLSTFEPVLKSLAAAGLPYLGTAVGAMLTPVMGPFGMLVSPAINLLVPTIAKALGLPDTATPTEIAAKVDADPAAAKVALADLEEQHKFALATQKQSDDYAVASQAQQVTINTVEAQNPSLFVAGWRPLLAWGLGSLVMTSFTLPYLVWLAMVFGGHIPPPPPLDPTAITILSALLGITVVARSVDKATGVATPAIGGRSVTTTTKRLSR